MLLNGNTDDRFIIFDNHLHLNPGGRLLDAVDMFRKAGGDSFNLVNLPDNGLPLENYYELLYERTLKIAALLKSEKELEVPVTLGPYPLDYFRFKEKGLDPVEELRKGVDLAARYIEEGRAHAIGEVGRPHFQVPEEVMDHSNSIIKYSMERARELHCPVILHTDDLGPGGYALMEKLAVEAGIDLSMVVKHHALPVDLTIETGIQKSILASKSNTRKAASSGKPFLLETDYVDDINLGWKVIPPDSVPKRAILLKSELPQWESIFEQTFRRLPVQLFGEDMFSSFL